MKKITWIVLSLLLAISLAACGGNSPSKDAETRPADNTPLTRTEQEITSDATEPLSTDNSSMSLEDFLRGANRNSMTAEQIAALEADAAQNGYEIQWQADGSLVIVDDGNTTSLNGNWPDNAYTKGIPAPDFDILATSDDGSTFTAVFGEVTKEQVAAYAEALKEAGFTVDAETTDQDIAGMVMYYYAAGHADGRLAELVFSGAQSALTISK